MSDQRARAIGVSALAALGVSFALLVWNVLGQYFVLERFGIGHTLPKVVGLQVGRSPVFATLAVCFALTGLMHGREDSVPRAKMAIVSALAVPALQLPFIAVALVLSALIATPFIGFVPGAFFEVLDLEDLIDGVLGATLAGLAPVAVVFGAAKRWSTRPLGSKLGLVALLLLAMGILGRLLIPLGQLVWLR